MAVNLTRLLSPRSIVTVGGRECARVIAECDRMGFSGTVHAVHPVRERLAGRSCLRSVRDLADAPDAAFVAVPGERAAAVVDELAQVGCGGVIVYSADFAEAGHDARQRELIEAAGAMPLVGPNCYGLIDAGTGAALWPDVHGCRRLEPGVRGAALVAQSSNVAINLTMQRRGLPLRRVLTAGNAAQVAVADLARGALDDPDVGVLLMHVESIGDAQSFAAFAHEAHRRGIPIAVLKTGRSAAGQRAAHTHTASLAGGHAAHEAFFRSLGIASVGSLEALIETGKLLLASGPLAGRRIVSMSCSGGEAGLMADAGAAHGLAFPDPGPAREGLERALGPRVAVSNPLDYHTFVWGDRAATLAVFEAAAKVKADAAVLVLDWPRRDDDVEGWHVALDAFREAFDGKTVRPIVLASLPENVEETVALDLARSGIPWLAGFDVGAEAIAAAGTPAAPMPFRSLPELKTGKDRVWNEDQAKRALAAHGLAVPRGRVVRGVAEVTSAIMGLEPPFVAKALGLAHKSEHGAVRLRLTAETLREAVRDLLALSDAVLVEPMTTRPGVELLVGVSRDEVLGPVMTLGAGGVLAELLTDTATLLLPASEGAVREALARLRVAELLAGWRGADAADTDALVANILCIARFAERNADTLVELDVNPLIATAYGAVAVDALVVSRLQFCEELSPSGAR